MIKTVLGDDSFSVSSFIKELTIDFAKKHGKLAIEKYDLEEDELQTILDSILNFSLFAEEKLVLVRGVQAEKDFTTKLLDQKNNIPDTTDVLLIGGKPDKRAKSYKDLKKNTEFIEFNQSQERDHARWVIEEVKKSGGEITRGDANYLVDRVGVDKMNLVNEMKKLVIYDPKITRDSINKLTVPNPKSTIFELIDAAFSGNMKRAFTLYDEQRAQKIEPLAVVGMIAWQLQTLTILVLNKNKDQSVIAKEAKLNPFVIRKNMPLAMRLSRADLKVIINKAYELDRTLKNSPVDSDAAVKQFLLELKEVIS